MTQANPQTKPENTPAQPAAGEGMPAKNQQQQRSLPDQHESLKDDSVKDKLELPSDRDQAVDMTGGQNSALIEQAAQDIDAGMEDTSKAPEMDRTYKKQKP